MLDTKPSHSETSSGTPRSPPTWGKVSYKSFRTKQLFRTKHKSFPPFCTLCSLSVMDLLLPAKHPFGLYRFHTCFTCLHVKNPMNVSFFYFLVFFLRTNQNNSDEAFVQHTSHSEQGNNAIKTSSPMLLGLSLARPMPLFFYPPSLSACISPCSLGGSSFSSCSLPFVSSSASSSITVSAAAFVLAASATFVCSDPF